MQEWTEGLKWNGGSSDPKASIANVTVAPDIVEDFRPLAASLEWRISEHYWCTAGVLPFAENEVPFVVNNSGRLSENAATVLFAACEESKPEADICVLELGAGTGLFARFFLDAFRAVCAQENRDYYERLTYFVTDRSPATVAHWRERRLFSEHGAHVRIQTCDAATLRDACAVPFRRCSVTTSSTCFLQQSCAAGPTVIRNNCACGRI